MPFSTSEQYQAVVFQITGKFLGSIEGPAFKEKLEELKAFVETLDDKKKYGLVGTEF